MPDSAHSTTGDGVPDTIQPAGRAAPDNPGPSPTAPTPPAAVSGNGATAPEAAAASASNGDRVPLVEHKAKEPAPARGERRRGAHRPWLWPGAPAAAG